MGGSDLDLSLVLHDRSRSLTWRNSSSQVYEICRAPGANAPEGNEGSSAGTLLVGVILSVCAAALLAMSMNIQQYALTSPDIKEADKRYRLWVGGLAL